MSWREFVWGEGKSAKFWHVRVSGSSLTVHFGRVGTAGQKREKQLADTIAARKEAERLIRDKLGKGYVEQGTGSKSPATKATPSKPAKGSKTEGPASQGLAQGLRDAWALFEQRPDLFELQSKLSKPASATALAKAEKRIGHALPEPLRELYLDLGDGARFFWTPKREAAEVFKVEDASESRGGSFELLPLAKLRRIPDTEAWLFSNDGSGDGFAIDYSSKRPGVAWHTHDDDPIADHADDFARWLKDFIANGFTDEDDPLHGVVKRWLAGKRKLGQVAAAVAPKGADASAKSKPFASFPKLKAPGRAIAVLPDGRVAIGCDTGGVRLFDLRSGKALASFRAGLVLSLKVSPSGRYLAAACLYGLQVWDLENGTAYTSKDAASDVVFLDENTLLGLGRVWSYRYSANLKQRERVDFGESLVSARLSKSGELIIYGHDDRERPLVATYDPRSFKCKGKSLLDGIETLERGGVAVAGDVMVAGRGNGSVGKWKGAKCIQKPTGGDAGKYLEYTLKWPLGPIAYDGESDRVYAGYTGLEDDGARYPGLRCIAASSGATVWDHRLASPLWAVALAPDARRLVAVTYDARAYAADIDYIAEHGLS